MGRSITIALSLITINLAAGQGGLSWNGYLHTDLHLGIRDSLLYRGSEFRLDLKAEAKPSDKTRFYADLWLRTWGLPPSARMADLSNWRADLNLREAYIDLYGMPFAKLDLRIGRQRIAWGTADKLNPTDNLNPPDLEDIWDFGRHLGSDAVKLSFYPEAFTFTGIFIPFFEPAVLPRGNWAGIFTSGFALPPGLSLRSFTDSLIVPGENPGENAIVGIKAGRNVLGYDLSLSYVLGRDYLPLPRRIAISPADTLGGVNVRSELEFPRLHIFGADLAGSIADLGIWLETAVTLPDQEAVLTTDLSALGLGVADSVIRPKKPYVKYVFGVDYTFKNGIYANLQFLHGFIHERSADELEDYIMAGLDWKFFEEKFKIMPISGGVEIKDFRDLKDNYALIYAPEISYRPQDNTDLILGVRWIEGNGTTTFGRAKSQSEIYFRLKYSF
jgi:hypothetical protein